MTVKIPGRKKIVSQSSSFTSEMADASASFLRKQYQTRPKSPVARTNIPPENGGQFGMNERAASPKIIASSSQSGTYETTCVFFGRRLFFLQLEKRMKK